MTLTNILVSIDFSANATLTLAQAVDLSTTSGAMLTVVYIIPQVIFHPDWAANVGRRSTSAMSLRKRSRPWPQ